MMNKPGIYTTQYGIINHLQEGKLDYFNSVKTIKAYAGELKDVTKLNSQVPAIYVFMGEASPLAEQATHRADLLIVTKSDSFNKNDNRDNNMQLTEQVVNDYLGSNSKWEYQDYPFNIDTEDLFLRVASIDNKFAITIVELTIKDLY